MSKILFNGLMYEENGTGISVYTKKIMDRYIENESFNITCLLRKQYEPIYNHNSRICLSKNAIYNSAQRIIYEQIRGVAQYNKYDLIHFPDYATCLVSKAKKVITIQDMAMFTMKHAYTRKQVLVKQFLLKQSLNKVDGIVCSSYYAKQELLKYFPRMKNKKIEVIYPGVDLPKRIELDRQNQNSLLQRFHIKKPYILFVGTLAPSKNILNLLKAFEIIRSKGLEYQLVICGKKGWMYEELFSAYEKSSYKEDIIFTDFVSSEELEIIYANAKMFSSASLYEGFGFPPLEAMIRRIPVVVSDLEIFRETCDNAAVYYNPLDIRDIAQVLIKVLQDDNLQQVLIHRGYERAGLFNTENTVRQLYRFYQDVIGHYDLHEDMQVNKDIKINS